MVLAPPNSGLGDGVAGPRHSRRYGGGHVHVGLSCCWTEAPTWLPGAAVCRGGARPRSRAPALCWLAGDDAWLAGRGSRWRWCLAVPDGGLHARHRATPHNGAIPSAGPALTGALPGTPGGRARSRFRPGSGRRGFRPRWRRPDPGIRYRPRRFRGHGSPAAPGGTTVARAGPVAVQRDHPQPGPGQAPRNPPHPGTGGCWR